SSSQQASQMPTPSTTRRPLPEQTARLERKQQPTANQQRPLPPQAYLRNAQAAQGRTDVREAYTQKLRATQDYQQYDEMPATRPPYPRQQPPVDAAPTHYQSRPRPKQDVQR